MAEGSGVDMSAAPGKTGKPQHCRMSVLGIDLSGTRAWVQLGACVAGVFACGVTHDFVQELVFRYDAFDFGWFMTLWELLIFVGAAWLQLAHEDRSHEIRAIRWREFVSLTIVLAITQGSGSVALSYVNFPVKVVMKSCKLIPTMVLGLLILRRSYSVLEYVAAVMLCVGVATFTLVDSKVSPKFDMIGIALLCLAVAGDAITVNLQEKILRHLQCSKEQMMFASNIMASGWVFLLIAMSGELMKALTLLYSLPEIAGLLMLQGLSQYVGVSFYLALIQRFGGVVAVCVTSCRKVLTIALSFMAFAKPFSVDYMGPGALVLYGILLSSAAKQEQRNGTHEVFLTMTGVVVLGVSAWWTNL